MIRHLFVTGLLLCFFVPVPYCDADSSPIIVLDRPIHFLDPEGSDTQILPGTYQVKLVEGALQLIIDESTPRLLIRAQPIAHKEALTEPVGVEIPTNEDTVHLVLLLPGGEGTDAVGSYTGVKTRASGSTLPPISDALISQAVATTFLSKASLGATLAGTPSTPLLIAPGNNSTVNLVAPLNTSVTFTWKQGTGGTPPVNYKLCVTEVNKTCAQPGAWIYPFVGESPVTATSYTARLPAMFQGKRLRWSVSACAPSPLQPRTGGVGELCAASVTHILSWALPPPVLGYPADGTSASLRQLFNVQSVGGADYFLFCFSKPGVTCPLYPTTNQNTVVAEVRGSSQFSTPNGLAQFEDQTIHWTAAACNATFGCIYQQAVRAVTITEPTTSVTCTTLGNEIRIRNGQYAAQIPRNTVGMSVTRLNPDGSPDSVAFSGDGIGLGFHHHLLPANVTDAQVTDLQVSVDKCYSFYARLSVSGKLNFPNLATFVVKRTYEFTKSPNIYVQLELRLERAFGPVRVVPEDSIHVPSFTWSFRTDPRTKVLTTTGDLFVQVPDGPLGGLDSHLVGHHGSPASLVRTNEGWARYILSNYKMADAHAIVLLSNRTLLSNSVIAINSPDPQTPLDFSDYQFSTYQYYPRFGQHRLNTGYLFNQWNSYQPAMEDISPISPAERNRQKEDALIRYTIFLIERLAIDQGWWTLPRWEGSAKGRVTQYPRGDRAATNSRSFPALAYVWAHLTMRRTPAGWTHVPSDADFIYHELQKTYPYYINSDPAQNLADNSPSGIPDIPYIAYSAHHRERLGGGEPTRRIINAHGTALHFAWLMQEASRLFGDSVREQQWATVVARYHEGSKKLFQLVYPGQNPNNPTQTYRGLIDYSPFQREVMMPYQSWTFSGIAAGYLNAVQFEPEFADVVERVSRLDSDPFDAVIESAPLTSYAARLARVFPSALAFARPDGYQNGICIPPYPTQNWQLSHLTWGPDMSRDLGAASLTEVLEYDRSRGKRIHNPAKVISEGNGRKWIRTNTQFLSYWAPGFWEEVDSNQVPANGQFDIQVAMPPPPHSCLGNHYSAYRMGNKIFIMTDYSGGTITLEFPGVPVRLPIVKRQTYNQSTGRWDPEENAPGVISSRSQSRSSVLVQLTQVQQKVLTIVEIQP